VDARGESPEKALAGKEEKQAMSRRRKKRGGSGAVCQLLFADSCTEGLCPGGGWTPRAPLPPSSSG